ncbi:glycosyltransferase family 4 protein [Uliginosibacterium gangwonense]|uniref:glycosyltransferase family 4 protein n=1 Tax=Uliginosibacterium gangwonense TaxID=392736 RepID=UPI0003A7839C|nr:glycosyltransferase family 4 protein [Uliginosibacterium gangwonense]
MKINIAASHRFHLLDLAIELEKLGHDVRFYSFVPRNRAVRYGLKKKCSVSLFIPMIPFLALFKISKGSYWSIRILHCLLDWCVSILMRPCDVCIALGTVYDLSINKAKKKYGSVVILEWGSKHIEEQQRILNEIPEVKKQPKYFTDRTVRTYESADYIAIPSEHVERSFVERKIPVKKIFRNPYGVNISMFHPTKLDQKDTYDIITVGSWSYQKGSDILVEVCKEKKYRLMHVGSLVDVDFPSDNNFTHVDRVDQTLLVGYYAKAKIFVLPSRQDGLAMVQLQAIICGLPLVCSEHTGGRDLRSMLFDSRWIIEMREYNKAELDICIKCALDLANTQTGVRCYVNASSNLLSWDAYGKRYHDFILGLKTTEFGI